jgi:hypothetical protein
MALCDIVGRDDGTSTERKRENRVRPAAVAGSMLMALVS